MNLIPGQIVYCNITAETVPRPRVKAKTLQAKQVVFGVPYSGYNSHLSWADRDDRLIINRFGVEEDLMIVKVDVISTHGFMNKQILNTII
jgi:predicted aminopeptidase